MPIISWCSSWSRRVLKNRCPSKVTGRHLLVQGPEPNPSKLSLTNSRALAFQQFNQSTTMQLYPNRIQFKFNLLIRARSRGIRALSQAIVPKTQCWLISLWQVKCKSPPNKSTQWLKRSQLLRIAEMWDFLMILRKLVTWTPKIVSRQWAWAKAKTRIEVSRACI